MKSTDLSRRLKEARENAGFKSASDAARRMGINVVTYTAHENGGREYDREAAIFYAKNFQASPSWLMFGEKDDLGESALPDSENVKDRQKILTPAVSNHLIHALAETEFEDFWEMPERFIQERLRIGETRARFLEIRGDSMFDPDNVGAVGSMYPGERVIVDLDDKIPSPPGPFVIYDGAGLMVKIIETIPFSDPPSVRLSSRNPRYATYERPMNDAGIVGRVKAKVSIVV